MYVPEYMYHIHVVFEETRRGQIPLQLELEVIVSPPIVGSGS